MWCQAGSSTLCFSDIFGASSDRWYLALMLRISQMLLGRVLLVYLFLVYTDCRKMLTMVLLLVFLVWIVLGRHLIIMAIAVSEAAGLLSEWSRIFFSFIIFIASLHVGRSRMFLPPMSGGQYIMLEAICGGDLEFHMKVLILLVRCFSMCCGIPWATVRNWVIPPIVIWMMCFLLSSEGYAFSQVWRLFSIFSIVFGQGSDLLWSFPACALRQQVVPPSFRMFIGCGNL